MNKHKRGTSEIGLVDVRILPKEYPIDNILMKKNHMEGRPGSAQGACGILSNVWPINLT
jgi:hypothetical protein